MRGAYLHVLGDLLGSVGAITAAIVILLTGWYLADPLISVFVGILIMLGAWRLTRESVDILLDAVPKGIDAGAVHRAILDLDGVEEVHDLHIWTLTSGMYAMSGHVVIRDPARYKQVLEAVHVLMHDRFRISHVTVQVEHRTMYPLRPSSRQADASRAGRQAGTGPPWLSGCTCGRRHARPWWTSPTPSGAPSRQRRHRGVAHLWSLHTTCALTVNEGFDPDVVDDVVAFMRHLVPRDAGFRHAEGNSDSHIKTSAPAWFGALLGMAPSSSRTASRAAGPLAALFFLCEWDGPRSRRTYRATAGHQPVWDEAGHAIASVFYVYYERTDIRDRDRRPLVFSFNGGPGSASLWMHIGYTGPRFLEIDPEGFPVQPYGVRDNPHSILDVADIVFVDPVNTGFSRIIGAAGRDQFFGVYEDIAYLARWIDTFVSRHQRWTAPKFLIGESYGTNRVSGLARRLQGSHWMNLNGVILVSPTGLGVARDGPVGAALSLPYFAATAWYHRVLAADLQQRDLEELLPEVEAFTITEYIPALTRGGSLDREERSALARRVARYSGLDEQVVLNHNLAVPTAFFWKELLRDRGLTVGRLDSRYRGTDRADAGERYDYDPALTAWNHAFAPAINHYLRDVLGYR
jgi:secondary thiamine-phosphate synthase enzyme